MKPESLVGSTISFTITKSVPYVGEKKVRGLLDILVQEKDPPLKAFLLKEFIYLCLSYKVLGRYIPYVLKLFKELRGSISALMSFKKSTNEKSFQLAYKRELMRTNHTAYKKLITIL